MFTAEKPRGKLLDTSERGPRTILVDVESFWEVLNKFVPNVQGFFFLIDVTVKRW